MEPTETAISLNFKRYSDKPGVVVDARTGQEHSEGAFDTKVLVYEDRVHFETKVVRVVRENAATLKFGTAEFEEE